MTDAVYIFGSYGTKYYDSENSDIDIAWFTNKEIYGGKNEICEITL